MLASSKRSLRDLRKGQTEHILGSRWMLQATEKGETGLILIGAPTRAVRGLNHAQSQYVPSPVFIVPLLRPWGVIFVYYSSIALMVFGFCQHIAAYFFAVLL